MKTTEEKAKAYDNVVGKPKRFMAQGVDPLITRADVQDFFPEVKESEDERIRKEIIATIHLYYAIHLYYGKPLEYEAKEMIAWLEKQGEQIHANSAKTCKEEKTIVIIPKFRIGDEIKTANEESLIITKIDEKGYWSEDLFICDFDEECLWDLVEQNHAWSEEDESWFKEIELMCLNFSNDTDYREKFLTWLKSLKEIFTWKPSEEQMELIKDIVFKDRQKITRKELAIFHSIYNDLKKLREE